MIAWYQFEGNGNDFLGANNATLFGTSSFAGGKVNQAWQLTDAGARVANSATLRPSAAVTVEGWLKATSPGTFGYILAKNRDNNGASYALYTGASGGLIFYTTVNNILVLSPDAGTSVWNGQFHHVAGVYDGAKVHLYVDGAEVGSGTSITGTISYGTTAENGDLLIGRVFASSGFNFVGSIDEMTFYNRGLTASEIQGIFIAGSGGKCTSAATPTPTPAPTPTPTPPALATVSGRAFTSDGRGLRNATVTMTDSQNVVRTATTSSFGFFSFDNVAIGGTYTFRVGSRLYRYQPQTAQVNGNMTLPDFVGLE